MAPESTGNRQFGESDRAQHTTSDNAPSTLLEALPESISQSLKTKQFTLKFPAGTQILRQEDSSKDVFFINYGKVLVTLYTERGDKLSFAEMHAGQSFGGRLV